MLRRDSSSTDKPEGQGREFQRDFRRESKDFTRVNHQIRVPKIRVVLDDGGMLGVMSPSEAMRHAEQRGLDLVEISPKAVPPVCKIMDYGKFKYELKKKSQSQKKTTAGNIVKEIILSPGIDIHDFTFKSRNAIRFLEHGHRVKVTVRFRGRENAHPEIGFKKLEEFRETLKTFGQAESEPKKEGKMLHVLITPLPTAVKAKNTKKKKDLPEDDSENKDSTS